MSPPRRSLEPSEAADFGERPGVPETSAGAADEAGEGEDRETSGEGEGEGPPGTSALRFVHASQRKIPRKAMQAMRMA
jgi:hypothetical protein